jgi:Fe-S cluster assembly scaffold protein SufB
MKEVVRIKEIDEKYIRQIMNKLALHEDSINSRVDRYKEFLDTPIEYYDVFLKYRDLGGYRYEEAKLKFITPRRIYDTPLKVDLTNYSIVYIRLPNNRYYIHVDPKIKAEVDTDVDNTIDLSKEHNSLLVKDKFGYLVDSLYTWGTKISVKEKQLLTKPILIYESFDNVEPANKLSIDIGDENNITIYHVIEGTPENLFYNIDLSLGNSVQLNYRYINNLDSSSILFLRQDLVIRRRSKVDWLTADFGGALVRSKRFGYLIGEGAELTYKGAIFGSKKQYFDITNYIKHIDRNSRSDVEVRGALKDEARLILKGMVEVEKDISNVRSSLKEHTIILNPGARADSLPGLEIKSSNVRVTHSASTIPLDPDMIYYLMTRGLNRTEAGGLIIRGFYRGILEKPLEKFDLFDIDKVINRKLGE